MTRKYEGMAIGIFLITLSIFMYINTFSIKKLTETSIGSQFVPQLVAGGIFLCSVILVATEWKKIKQVSEESAKLTAEAAKPVEANENAEEIEPANYKSVTATVGLIIGYIVLLPYLGFSIMTALYLILQMLILTERSKWKIGKFAIISVATSLFIYYIFRSVFHVMLPSGILG